MVYRSGYVPKKRKFLENVFIDTLCSTDYFVVKKLRGKWI